MESTIADKKQLYSKLLEFPPFFTIQEHQESRKKQLAYWSELIHSYCKDNKIVNSSVSEIWGLPITQHQASGIPRRLSKEDVVIILKQLEGVGSLKFTGENILIYHFSPYQMADDMYRWAKENFLIGDVQTLQFIGEGNQTSNKDKFYKQPKEVLAKVVDVLEARGKAAKIEIGNEISVKFL